ncbi:MAG: ATP-grasp domain-containing protein [Cyclobacteriaceae bacterium]
MKVLITGCGGDIGQSIGKIFKDIGVELLVGTDMNSEHPAKFIFDKVIPLLGCTDEAYIPNLEKIVKELSIDLVIPSSEPEMKFLLGIDNMDFVGNARIIMPSLDAMKIGFDKLETVNFLKANQLPYPKTEIVSSCETIRYPSILKSRSGSGSKTIHVVNDETDFKYLKQKYPNFIVQEYIDGEAGEFTCCAFKHREIIRTIIIKRKLKGEYTVYGEVVENDSIDNLLIEMANQLNLVGSINVQLRLKEGIPYVFEINPRFSSTVYFRHMLGFRDMHWSYQGAIDVPLDDYMRPRAGSKIYKGYQEYVELSSS